MTYRLSALAMLLMLGGCDFDLGSDEGKRERTATSLTTDVDGGTSVVNQQGCVFVPCDSAYGTSCGFVCPSAE